MTTSTQKFSEFISQDDEGNICMRLGHSTYFEKGRHIYVINKDGTEQLITLERERTFQRKKNLAIALQRTHIPLRERREYKRRAGWVGAR